MGDFQSHHIFRVRRPTLGTHWPHLDSIPLACPEFADSLQARNRRCSTLRVARPISVRDEASSKFLSEQGISHSLVPDLVHAIALTRPREPASSADYILVHASERWLRSAEQEAFAESVAELARREGSEIRLFVAGTANGHDSVPSYLRLANTVRKISPSASISISAARRPWDRVDEIQQARLWIGTSLHGRVVAAAYGVPRVSLDVKKVARYAATWDPNLPYGVRPDELVEASVSALSAHGRVALLEHGRELGSLANDNMERAVAATLAGEFAPSVKDRFASLEGLREAESERYERQQARDGAVAFLRKGTARGAVARISPRFRRYVRSARARVGQPPSGDLRRVAQPQDLAPRQENVYGRW